MANRGTRLSLISTRRTPTTQCYATALVTAIAATIVGLSGHAFVAIAFSCGAAFFFGSAIVMGLRRAARVIDRADSVLPARRHEDRHTHDLSSGDRTSA